MKKIIISLLVLLVSVTLFSLLAGCAQTQGTTGGSAATTPSASSQQDYTAPGASDKNTTAASDLPQPPVSGSGNAGVTTTKPGTPNPPPTTTAKQPDRTTATPVKPPATTPSPSITTAPADTTPPPEEGVSITVNYVVNDPSMGSLLGRTTQVVKYGVSHSSTVSATAKLGYRFVGWSDGSSLSTRSGDCPKKDTTYTAIFDYDFKELPVLSLRTDSGLPVTDKENYVNGSISMLNADAEYIFDYIPMEIRGRGNYTWNETFKADERYNKRPFRIKLSEKKNLLGIGNGKAKVWVLLANHCDQSLLRNQTVYNFAKSLSHIIWQPAATSVEVYFNGEYIGVYMLTEQVQVNSNRIDLPEEYETSPEIGFLIQMSGYSEDPMFYVAANRYEIKNDLSANSNLAFQQQYYIQDRIQACWDAVVAGNKDRIAALIDIDSVIDTYIVHELFKNLDTGWDNFYMFSDIGDVLHFGPVWDFDQCAGNADEGVEDYRFLRGGNTNPWYSNFLKLRWFQEMLQKRWDELLPEIRKIPNTILSQGKAGYNSYCRNFDRWDIWGLKINRETEVILNMHTYQEHVDYFAQWMTNRIDWINTYWHSAEFLPEEVKLTLKGSGTKNNPYRVSSAADFYNFTQMLQTGETFAGKYFQQTADIDMRSLSYYNGLGARYTFAGTYDGAGHSITANISGSDNSFFPYVTGTIMNLVTAGSIDNTGITGGIARSVRVGGKIVNCLCLATLSSSENVGGIVASNQEGGGTVVGCVFAGTIVNANGIGPINVYYDNRRGVFGYNYYASDYTSEENQYRHTVASDSPEARPDTSFARREIQSLINSLNANLNAAASMAGVSRNDLCTWTYRNGNLALTVK